MAENTLSADINKIKDKTIALVLDGYINGLGVARSLRIDKEIYIVTLSHKGSPIAYSNTVNLSLFFEDRAELLEILLSINSIVNRVIPYFCSDRNIELLWNNKVRLDRFLIPYSNLQLLEKDFQMGVCDQVGIKVPKSWTISTLQELHPLEDNKEYIIKPVSSGPSNPFKTKITNSKQVVSEYCQKCLSLGIKALVSEYIPGDDRSLVAIMGYAQNGVVLNHFTGRKIAQRPKYNGVASMAESIVNKDLLPLIMPWLETVGYTGIFHFEFKEDKNGDYYFIELNARNWSWGYVATINGRNLILTKYYSETKSTKKSETNGVENFYFWGEGLAYNIFIDRWPGAIIRFIKALTSKRVTYAVFSWRDPLPYFISVRNICLYVLGLRTVKR